MKKVFANILVFFAIFSFYRNIEAYSQVSQDLPAEEMIDLRINKGEKQAIKINEPVKQLEGKFSKEEQEKIRQILEVQKKIDVDDIKNLWNSTVDRNPVIKFALRKLTMPPEQRRVHSSIMARSVSALISGVAFLPSVFGADSMVSSASYAGGSLANRFISSKTTPKEVPLSDTELIHLAGLIEDLQDRIIKNYYDYKSSIESLKICRDNLTRQNKNYSEALKVGNEITIIAASALYDKELYNEIKLKQDIKVSRLELERLAGSKAVDELNLAKIDDNEIKNISLNDKGNKNE